MNESLAFKHSLPIYSYGADADNNTTYPAIEAECIRLVSLLRDNGFFAETIILPAGSNARCIRNMGETQFSLKDGVKPDVVLVLACPDGFWGLSRVITPDVPLINISKWKGIIFYRYVDDEKRRIIERGKITPFVIETQKRGI